VKDLTEKFADIEPLVPGKNAAVFKATNKLLGREAFLKVYEQPEEESSALREPQLLAKLQHDRLACIRSADRLDDGRVVLEMELLREGSFQSLIDANETTGKWPEVHTVARLISDAASGLGYLHARGYVHRDVKPANLMLKREEQRVIGVVTDLGLAAKLGPNNRAGDSKQARLYRPPEAFAGKGYSPSSDVYQLGVVLFQMLGGKIRYSLAQLDDTALAAAIRAGELVDWDTLGPHIDKPMRGVIQHALRPESYRFQSMNRFRTDLNNALAKQFDWVYLRAESGFTLARIDDKRRELRVVVERREAAYVVQRYKRALGPDFRRVGDELEIQHKDLSTCRKFQKLLKGDT
jgi:serine/threonine protein kinase